MKRTILMVLMAVIVMAGAAHAAPKKDGKPDGGVLSYGEYGRPATLDPITSNEMISLRLTELLFNGLVGINEKQEIVPELAERWEVSKDGRTYTFFLRKDVTWHAKEGEQPKPFTADDVIFTWKIMTNPRTITPLKVRYEFIQSVQKTDDYTVVFTLKRPILNALAKFSFKIIPQHGPANKEFLTRDDPFVQHPIGTGPYQLKAVTPEREIVLVANENYFKGRPHINQFSAKPFADQNIMTQALMFNAIDMIVLVNPRDIPEIEGDKRFVLKSYNALSYSFFGYNMRNPLLADRNVRKAFTYAVNRQEMLDSFFNGRGTIISGPFAPGSWA
jgi:peptide/nickel transport system substrate-binding protein